jgi:hypothetical protein
VCKWYPTEPYAGVDAAHQAGAHMESGPEGEVVYVFPHRVRAAVGLFTPGGCQMYADYTGVVKRMCFFTAK